MRPAGGSTALMNSTPPAEPSRRLAEIDALRGVAIVWMAVFHFCFDLNYFGFFTPKYHFTADPLWTTQRTCIVTLFLFCAGLALATAMSGALNAFLLYRGLARAGVYHINRDSALVLLREALDLAPGGRRHA